jgi:hypothetical protein
MPPERRSELRDEIRKIREDDDGRNPEGCGESGKRRAIRTRRRFDLDRRGESDKRVSDNRHECIELRSCLVERQARAAGSRASL